VPRARNFIVPLLPLIQAGRLQHTRIITHTMLVADTPKGYEVMLKP